VSGVATAAPAVNFKRLALNKRREARKLMGRERDALPGRWQQRQERLERLRAAGRLPAANPGRVRPFRAEPAAAPSPALATSFKALDDNGLFVPPDTEGAPGLDKLLVTVNGTVQIQNKSDGSVVSATTLDSFFGAIPGAGIVFDPHVMFDPYASRWIVVAVSNADSSAADVLLAVSQTSDPAGSWNEYSVDVDAMNRVWGDYPTVGFNKNWIVVSLNMFTTSADSFAGTQTYAFDKAKAYAGAGSGGGAYQLFALAGDDFTLAPAATYDPSTSDLYLAEDYDGGSSLPLRLFRLSGPVGSATLTRLGDPSGAALSTLGSWSDVWGGGVGFAPQLGSTKKIDNGDARLTQCVYRNAAIWCANTVFLPAAAPTHSAVQWYEIDPTPASPNVVHAGRIGDPTGFEFFAYPSIAVNRYNDALLGFSRFASNQYASADYAYRACSDSADTFRDEAPYQPGLGSYFKTYSGTVNRWGDFSGTWVDPSDDSSLWTIQEYAKLFTGPPSSKDPGTWGTWWGMVAAQAHTGPAALTPVSSDHTPGVESANGVVHVSWTPTDDCAVSYVYKWSTSPTDPPNPATDGTLPRDAVSLVSPPLTAGSSWWLHLEAVDGGGAPSPVADLGPFPIVSAPPPPPPTQPQPPPGCVVPAVRRLLLATARTRLLAAHCSAGTITWRFSRTIGKGRVISQAATPGKQLASGAKVNLVVSKGRAPFRPPLRVTLCYRHHTVHVSRAVAKRLRRHGALLGACRKS
jgi:PASTA domain-containing protein